MLRRSFEKLPPRVRSALSASLVLVVCACGSDRGVPENIAGGWHGGGVEGLSEYKGCYRYPDERIPSDGAAVVTFDSSVTYQTMDGFGASMRLFDDPRVMNSLDPVTKRAKVIASATDQLKILDSLWSDAGLTRVRFLPDAGIEPVNDNADPMSTDPAKFDFDWTKSDGLLDLVPALSIRGMRTYFISIPALESWMTESDPAEYAEWLMVVLRRWRGRGYELPYISLKNEPGSAVGGRAWSATFLRDVTKLLGARIKAEGMSTKIVVPDDVNASEAFARLQVILADADARQYIGAIAYHVGSGGGEQQVKQLAEQYGIPIWVTGFDTPGWFETATTMHDLIANDGAVAVDYTWGFFGEQATSQLIRLEPRNGEYWRFIIKKQYFAMGQYSRYIPRRAVRIKATSSDPNVLVTAYRDGFRLIVVVVHTGSPDGRQVRLELAGVPCVKRYSSVLTSDAQNWSGGGQALPQSPRISVFMPSHSIVTIVGDQ